MDSRSEQRERESDKLSEEEWRRGKEVYKVHDSEGLKSAVGRYSWSYLYVGMALINELLTVTAQITVMH